MSERVSNPKEIVATRAPVSEGAAAMFKSHFGISGLINREALLFEVGRPDLVNAIGCLLGSALMSESTDDRIRNHSGTVSTDIRATDPDSRSVQDYVLTLFSTSGNVTPDEFAVEVNQAIVSTNQHLAALGSPYTLPQ